MNTIMKIPGPDHPISIAAYSGRVRVICKARVVADSERALAMYEKSYPPRFYIPRDDAEMTLFERSAHRTYCPYKGDASYYSIRVGDSVAQDAVWSYERPFAAVAAIGGYLAFYPDRVDAIDLAPA